MPAAGELDPGPGRLGADGVVAVVIGHYRVWEELPARSRGLRPGWYWEHVGHCDWHGPYDTCTGAWYAAAKAEQMAERHRQESQPRTGLPRWLFLVVSAAVAVTLLEVAVQRLVGAVWP